MLEKIYTSFLLFFLYTSIFAQISAPKAEAVFGGRITDIAACSIDANHSRVFVSTESANSAFYADVDHTGSSPVVQPFQPLAILNASAAMGPNIQMVDVVPNNGAFVFQHDSGLFASSEPYTDKQLVSTSRVRDLYTIDNLLFFLDADRLIWGQFDSLGLYRSSVDAPLHLPVTNGRMKIQVNPADQVIYICNLEQGKIFYTDAPYHSINASTSFNSVSIDAAIMNAAQWQAFGIAPDGRFFLGGNNESGKHVAYSSDLLNWTEFSTTVPGIAAANFAFAGNAASYHVYFASVYNHNKGKTGSWIPFGNFSHETHPNDGPVMVDPINPSLVYLTSDQGIAVSEDEGISTYEINKGIEAVQVKDMDMTLDKTTAWIASKSGVRRVDNYPANPIWSRPMFPNGDGSPYYSTEINMLDRRTVYVGNTRVYKSINNGTTWSQIFTAESSPYHFSSVGYRVNCLEMPIENTNLLMAGYVGQQQAGGLFVSEDEGGTWNQILIKSSSNGPDVNVNDIEIVIEDTDTIAYVGVEYQMGGGYSIYRVKKETSGWSVEQDMDEDNTTTGSQIIISIADLEVSPDRKMLFATGTDAGSNHPVAYFKSLTESGLWKPFTSNGFPILSGKQGAAITIGRDTLYCAVDHEIYYHEIGSDAWHLGYAYPPGTEINFLYFDDLLAGTGTGLYGHASQGGITSNELGPQVSTKIPITVAPNPVSSEFKFNFALQESGTLRIAVYDNQGKAVYSIFRERMPSGEYDFSVDSMDWPAGIYRLSLETSKEVSTISIVKLDLSK